MKATTWQTSSPSFLKTFFIYFFVYVDEIAFILIRQHQWVFAKEFGKK